MVSRWNSSTILPLKGHSFRAGETTWWRSFCPSPHTVVRRLNSALFTAERFSPRLEAGYFMLERAERGIRIVALGWPTSVSAFAIPPGGRWWQPANQPLFLLRQSMPAANNRRGGFLSGQFLWRDSISVSTRSLPSRRETLPWRP